MLYIIGNEHVWKVKHSGLLRGEHVGALMTALGGWGVLAPAGPPWAAPIWHRSCRTWRHPATAETEGSIQDFAILVLFRWSRASQEKHQFNLPVQ